MIVRKRAEKAGLPPGTPVLVGERKVERVQYHAFRFNAEQLEERHTEFVKVVLGLRAPDSFLWIDVVGLHEVDAIRTLAEAFELHPLTLEDILSTHQRPKLEEFPHYLYLVLRMLRYEESTRAIASEQVSFVLGRDFLLTFQESEGDVFEPVRQRLRSPQTRLRTQGIDFLAYSLIDAIVDQYFVVLEQVGDAIEAAEHALMEGSAQEVLRAIQAWRHEMVQFSRAVWPLREALASLMRSENNFITPETRLYMRDVYDHLVYVLENLTTYREMLGHLVEIYLSAANNRLNEVMKVLTIIATIFIPLNFVASIYGMNFEYMPELRWVFGYPLVLLVMALIAGGLLVYFRRRGWL